jgi:alkylation response protein AidB-like acyl-CoA dehydrogenase
MDFDLSDDQQLLMTAFDSLLDRYRKAPEGVHGYHCYSPDFQEELSQSGFLDVVTQPGFGVLEGALIAEAAASCANGAEVASSVLVGPLLDGRKGPVAFASGIGKPARFLEQAGTVCIFDGVDVIVGTPGENIVLPIAGVVAYPLASLTALPADAWRISDEVAAAIRRRATIGVAAEAAGLMRAALENTVRYVKEREQFGQPLGNFQAIQHRLAEDAQLVRACRWLTFRAADADSSSEAALACLYAQEAMRKVITDCHQFSGAMGLTLEFPLHLWTYRLKFLQGELGGKSAQARSVAADLWPVSVPAASPRAEALGVA